MDDCKSILTSRLILAGKGKIQSYKYKQSKPVLFYVLLYFNKE